MLKLNLGCGIYYKPGFVNIDKFEDSVADQQADLFFLPYSDNSVDEIEASHIVEHFDIIHVPYLLAEWWRVLKPEGVLFIEIPNLWKTIVNIWLHDYVRKIQSIRYLFGVDLPGNFHKSGFTRKLLKKILEKAGFVNYKRIKQVSFHSESGIRLRVEKSSKKVNLIAKFRLQILKKFPPPQVLLYSAIESNILDTLQSANSDSITDLIINYCIFHPQIADIFAHLLSKPKQSQIDTSLLEFLIQNKFQSLLYANWINWSKSSYNLQVEFNKFIIHWKERLLKSFNGITPPNMEFSYILSQNHPDLVVPFLSIEYIALESQKTCNQGLKAFQESDLETADRLFNLAIRINPSNEIAHWNLARIFGIRKEHKKALERYKVTGELIRERKIMKKLGNEIGTFLKKHISPKFPLQIRY